MKTKTCLILIFPLLAVSLTGLFSCGGGGGGGGGGLAYTGVTTQAQITEDNATLLTFGTWNTANTGTSIDVLGAVQTTAKFQQNSLSLGVLPLIFEDVIRNMDITSMAASAYLGAVNVNDTITGACNDDNTVAGGAGISGSVNDDGVFNITASFNNYCEYEQEETVTINGTANLSGTLDPATLESDFPDFFDYTFTFTALSLDYPDTDEGVTLNGSFTANWVASPMLVTMSFVLRDDKTMTVYWFKDVTLSLAEGPGYTDIISMTGRYYDPDYGFVEIFLDNTINIDDKDNWPSNGSFILTGTQGTKARLTFEGTNQFMVQVDTDGDGVYEFTDGPFSWAAGLTLKNPRVFSENAGFSDYFSINDYYWMRLQFYSYYSDMSLYWDNSLNGIPLNYSPTRDLVSAPYYTYINTFTLPPPGNDWEGTTYDFYADNNKSQSFDAEDPFVTCTVPVGAFNQLGLPVVSITDGSNPVISWEKVAGAVSYVINIFELTEQNGLGNIVFTVDIEDDGSSSYSYTYNGDLFNSYPLLAVMVLAKDSDTTCYYNRSFFVTTHGK